MTGVLPRRPDAADLAREVRDVVADLPRFLTAPLLRPWHRHWGATPAEVVAPMPGDEEVPGAQYRCTRAITVGAPPEEVWPWLVQVGCLRGVRERAEAEHRRRVPPVVRPRRLAVIRSVHTAAWFSIESCVGYLLWSGAVGRSDRRAAAAAAVVAGKCLVFAGNGFRCPLTGLAESAGAASGSVTDVYLPRWFARNLPAIHLPLLALIGWLHLRTPRRRGPRRAAGSRAASAGS